MIRAYLAAAIRAAEAPALAAGEPLMQRAGAAVAQAVRDQVAEVSQVSERSSGEEPHVLVLVGGGNNGGDGLYAAADLAPHARVLVALTRAEVHEGGLAAAREAGVAIIDLSAANLSAADLRAASVSAANPSESDAWADLDSFADIADVWVDAVAGIGVRGPLRGVPAQLIERLNHLREVTPVPPVVIAVDIPSGMDADTGATHAVIPADLTITFGAPKAGLLLPPGDRAVGNFHVATLGLEQELAAQPVAISRLQAADAADLWPVPELDAHKYSRGVVGVMAGSEAYPGAAVLTTGAALRTGCGMVRYLGPSLPTSLVLQRWPEAVTAPGRVQAWVVGPGVGAEDEARRAEISATIREAVSGAVGLVVDAGALDLLPERDQVAQARVVLTPHAGEVATLLTGHGEAVSRAEVETHPHRWAARAAELTGATVLAKGPTSLIVSPDGESFSQADGTPWLATAGSGDVLAGILGALLAGMPEHSVAQVAALAAYVHGQAGREAGPGPIIASDLIEALPATIRGRLGL